MRIIRPCSQLGGTSKVGLLLLLAVDLEDQGHDHHEHRSSHHPRRVACAEDEFLGSAGNMEGDATGLELSGRWLLPHCDDLGPPRRRDEGAAHDVDTRRLFFLGETLSKTEALLL